MNLREVYKAFGGERSKEHASEFYSATLGLYIDLLTQIREAYGAVAGAVLTRKSRGHFGADDSSGSIARLADGDIPIDSLKSDIRRKKSLRQVMGPKHEDEEVVSPDRDGERQDYSRARAGILDDLIGDDADKCHDEDGNVVDCDDPSAVDAPLDEADMTDEEKKFNKEDVNYRYAGNPEQKCGNCKQFVSETGSCQIVSGLIRATDVCDKWEAGPVVEAMRTFKKLYRP